MSAITDALIDGLKDVAPVIATAAGGPIAGAAVSWLAQRLGIKKDGIASTVSAVIDTVQGLDPLERVKLEQDFQKWYIEALQKETQMYLDDTQNARARDTEFIRAGTKNTRANWIAGLTFIGILLCIGIAVGYSNLNEFGKSAVNLILGVLIADWKQITSFEFGTSKSSQNKDATIKNLSEKA